jgi:lipoprotein-releasing system permease protein
VGYPLEVAVRYLRAKKAAFISVGTFFAIAGVALGVAALAIVMSVTGGFQAQFRDKVLGVNAHVLVLKYSSDFREYRDVMKRVESMPGVLGASPFTINPMMVTSGPRTSTGVLLKGVDPDLMPKVLDVPKHVILPTTKEIKGLRREGAEPPRRPWDPPAGKLDFPDHEPPPPSSASANANGVDGKKDAEGRPVALMNAIKKAIDEADAKKAAQEAKLREETAKDKKNKQADKGNKDDKAPKDEAPKVVGNIEPEGGYLSQLPDDDSLPESMIPDPCGDSAEVAKLPGAVVGVTLAKNLDLTLGSCLQVTSPTIGYSYSGGALRPPIAKQFRVVAIFEAGFDQYDSKLVYVDLYEAQAFYDMGDSVTGVEMKVANIEDARDIARAIDTKLDNAVYHTMDWEELNHGLFTALRIQQILMSAVLALIIVVAAFTVVATLIMIVLEKRKEIAVLKAMGARDSAILRIFLYQGGIIGSIGTGTGLAIGALLCVALRDKFPLDPKVYFISRLPVDVRPMEFAITGVIAVVICLLATVAPALYAAWLKPTDGFRDLG